MIQAPEALPAPSRVQPIHLEGKLLPLPAQAAAELNLRDGQVVQALVRSAGAEVALLLRGKLIQAPDLPLAQPGASMWLRVSLQADGSWGLLPMSSGILPQAAAEPLVSRIASLLYRPADAADLPGLMSGPTVSRLLESLRLPELQAQWRGLQMSLSQLTPEAMRAALLGAMGSEVALARGRAPLNNDPKQFLRKLMQALDQQSEEPEATSERDQIKRAIDQLEANQVQAVQAQAQREMLFSMTLPFSDGSPVELVFRRPPRQPDGPPVITVNIHTRHEWLGPLWLQTRLVGLDQVDLIMWAPQGETAAQARSRQAELDAELRQAGLVLQGFQVIHGARPKAESEWVPSGRGLVVDLSA